VVQEGPYWREKGLVGSILSYSLQALCRGCALGSPPEEESGKVGRPGRRRRIPLAGGGRGELCLFLGLKKAGWALGGWKGEKRGRAKDLIGFGDSL